MCIGKHARIEGVFAYNGKRFSPVIEFGEGCTVEQGLHLTCANRVSIGQNTAIAAYVTISDIHHPYENVDMPIEKQDIEVSEVVIGDDCKLYNGVVITPGVHIGKHVTIGANAVVTKDIPDYCVAVGAPARIIKQYNASTNKWERVDFDVSSGFHGKNGCQRFISRLSQSANPSTLITPLGSMLTTAKLLC